MSMTGSETRRDPAAGVAFVALLYRRWKFVVAQAVAAVIVLLVVLSSTGKTTYDFTAHFVLHPDPNSTKGDVANGISVLAQDGPLVQTVLKVLGSGEILNRAGQAAGIKDMSQYSISATVSPGSSFFDAGVTGDNLRETEALGKNLERVASSYVEGDYHGFRLDVLGSDEAKHKPFPPSPTTALLVFLLGAVAAAGELFVVFGLGRLRLLASAVAEAAADGEGLAAAPMAGDPSRKTVAESALAVEPLGSKRGAERPASRPNGISNGKRAKKAPSSAANAKKAPSAGTPAKLARKSNSRGKGGPSATKWVAAQQLVEMPAEPETEIELEAEIEIEAETTDSGVQTNGALGNPDPQDRAVTPSSPADS
jgi:hypothetical protein